MDLDKKNTDTYLKSLIASDENWNATDISFTENIMTTSSSLGIPEYFDPTQIMTYSEFAVSVPVIKSHGDSIIRAFTPIIILLMVLFSIYYFKKSDFVFPILIAVILGTVLYHANLLSGFNIEYIMAIEYSYFTIYLLAVMNLCFMIMINKAADSDTISEEKINKFKTNMISLNYFICGLLVMYYFFGYII
ncbi:MAG: hypothetical protein HN931_13610 [Desulfobacterales bacterium]|nr:hypothetical protein [Desulfobacterales bacterium]